MREAVLTAPRTIHIAERDLERPAHGQARLRVTQCGVCASELDVWTGVATDEPLPVTMGHEVAGVIEEVGPGVTTLREGDHVAAWIENGGFAEQAIIEERFSVPVAEGLSFAGVAEPIACVVNAVEYAMPKLGDDVVIVGAGFMGLLLLMVTALKGPRTITVADVRPDALQRASDLGATHVVDTRELELADTVKELTGGVGADVAYEVTGVGAGLRLAADATRMSGTLCIVGYHQGPDRAIPLGHWNWMAYNIVNAHFRRMDAIMAGMRAGMRLVSAGVLQPDILVTHRFPLEGTAEAFHAAEQKPDGFVKAVIDVDGSRRTAS